MMTEKVNELVHDLYNDFARADSEKYQEMLGVLQKVYLKLDKVDDPAPLINRLVNYVYSAGFNSYFVLSKSQEDTLRKLADIGKTAGLNGVYRSNYSDPKQF